MYGIDQEILNQLASQDTQHSFLKRMMSMNLQDSDKEKEKLSMWIEEETKKMFPKSRIAGRIVRESMLFLLENKAITSLLEKRPELIGYLPEVENPQEAAQLGAREVMYVPQEEIEYAEKMLRIIQNGILKP